jgi:hypothetical protein
MRMPRLTGCEPLAAPVTVKKPARVNRPERCDASSELPVAPYSCASAPDALVAGEVSKLVKLPSPPHKMLLTKSVVSLAIAVASSGFHSG